MEFGVSLHILFLTDNFPPEVNAPASRTYEHAIRWVEMGCKVTVITGNPNFPEGKIYPGYKNSWLKFEDMGGINVIRLKTYIAANEGFFRRILDYLSFMVVSFFAGLFQKKIDVIVATSPQFFTACSGWLLSIFLRRPFVFELRDIWPASIVAVGASKNSLIINFLEKLELFLYKKSKIIIAVTNSFKEDLINRGIDDKKIFVVRNGVDLKVYKPPEIKDYGLLKKYSLENKFVIGYIGTHGLAQGLEVVIQAAEKLKNNSKIMFVLIGSGASKNKLVRIAQEKKLDNILFINRQPKQLMSKYWSLCDLSLIHLIDHNVFSAVIPSKLFESIGMGIPVLMAIPEGEATKIVSDNQCGVIVPPEDYYSLARSITKIEQNKDLYSIYKKSAIKASFMFSRDLRAAEMLNILKNNVENS